MIPPNWINATDLNSWANRRDAQARLPQLLRRLINATIQRLQRIGFPAGESVQMGGWDGIVETAEGNAFVPDGCSVWELGTTSKIKGKAEDDYQKRCGNPLGLNPAETTFIFVTPRRWGGKDKWIRAKNSEGIWAEVRAYDADDLEQWLELAPAVHTWLALLIDKWSKDSQDIGSFWDEWINATSPSLTSALHLAGREQNAEKVKNWLNESPSKLTIQADSCEEAIAFLAAIIFEMPENERVQYLSRCVLVKSEPSWRYFASTQEPLILIPAFAQLKSIPQQHHVLVPIGREISPSKEALQLPCLAREGFRQALVNMGFSQERAYTLSQESKRSLLVLRRLLASNPEIHTPDWAKPENVQVLIPALLAGAWDGNKEADEEVISKLARKPYQEVIKDLSRWLNTSDPPIRQVGNVWQLISREVTWHFLSRFLIPNDFEVLEKTVLSVLGTLDPKYELPIEQQFAASIYGKELPHSNFLRQGLAETLAILSTRGLPLESKDVKTVQSRANSIISQLLNTDDWQRWASLSSLLPTLVEAAPEIFLELVEQGLEGESPTLVKLFQESSTGASPHTGLLWALEICAWKTDYLSRVSIILAKLSRLDPGGQMTKRPFHSLQAIFLCWTAPLEQRLRVINTLLNREPEITWNLLFSLLPTIHGRTSFPIHKDIDALIPHILANVGTSSVRLCNVIKKLEYLPFKLRDKVIDFIASMETTDRQDADIVVVWNSLRNVIYKHKEYSTARWAMPREVIQQLESIYHRFEPQNLIYRYAWLFSLNPQLLDSIGLDWEARKESLKQIQLETAREIYFQSGISALLEMAAYVQQPRWFGEAVARIEVINKDEVKLLKKSLGQNEKALNGFAIGFIRSRLVVAGWNWVETLISLAKSEHWSIEQLLNFFHGLPFEQCSWDLLSLFDEKLEKTYWQTIPIDLVKFDNRETVIDKLLNVNRPYAALNLAGWHLYEQPRVVSIEPRTLVKILEKAASVDSLTETPAPDTQMINYYIKQIFHVLDVSKSVEKSEIAKLEWIYFYVLRHSERQPKLLYQELSRDPLLFATIISFICKPENDGEESVEFDEAITARIKMSYELLDAWYQIPGLTEGGHIDYAQLKNWVLKARVACQESGRITIGDQKIGEMLAYAPKAPDGIWPDVAVREVIEEVSSRELERGIEIGILNKRGVWSKAIGEGGIQERQLAETYRSYVTTTIVDTYPRTASMLRRIADFYVSDAHREDADSELKD